MQHAPASSAEHLVRGDLFRIFLVNQHPARAIRLVFWKRPTKSRYGFATKKETPMYFYRSFYPPILLYYIYTRIFMRVRVRSFPLE